MRGRFFVAAIAAMLVWPAAASAQQVTGLTATQEYGFTTLKWTPVPNATDYQIERQSVDANDAPVGAATIVGLWQPIRQVNDGSPSFAESGYTLGGRYQWRVRARLGTANPQPYSERVVGTTQGHWGTGPGASLRTAWEQAPDQQRGQRAVHRRRRGGAVHHRARRGQRSHARGPARPHAHEDGELPRRAPGEHVRPRLPDADGDPRGDLQHADGRDQLQRARQ